MAALEEAVAEEIVHPSLRLVVAEIPQALHPPKEIMAVRGVLMVLLGQLVAVAAEPLLRQQTWLLPLLLLEMVGQEQHLLLLVRL
jgi:hypothetical protein